MQTVVIKLSRWKSAVALLVFGCLIVAPAIMYSVAPGLFDASNSSILDVLLIATVFAVLSLVGCFFVYKILKVKKPESPPLELNENGIRSNVSGLSEKFVPWEKIAGARLVRRHRGGVAVHVVYNLSYDELAKKSPTARLLTTKTSMTFWHQVLEINAKELVEKINEYKRGGVGPR